VQEDLTGAIARRDQQQPVKSTIGDTRPAGRIPLSVGCVSRFQSGIAFANGRKRSGEE
jgi:hypothetical protein